MSRDDALPSDRLFSAPACRGRRHVELQGFETARTDDEALSRRHSSGGQALFAVPFARAAVHPGAVFRQFGRKLQAKRLAREALHADPLRLPAAARGADGKPARRAQAQTFPPERYAALLAGRLRTVGSPADQVAAALRGLASARMPLRLLEEVALPARVAGYRPGLLDAALAQGEVFWQVIPGERPELRLCATEDVDWGAQQAAPDDLTPAEAAAYDALLRRGALFAQALAPLPDGVRPLDALTSLALRGLVHADSFAPLREWISDAKERSVKRRAMARATAQQAGRWEAVRPLREQTMEERLERAFDRRVLLCRETAEDIPWGEALEELRVWEYTGRVRRGYFVRGLSGAQFIREGDHAAAMAALESPDGEPVWLNCTGQAF